MAHIATSTKGSLNVELNIVPFIDLMSCMTAFLLVTAVWISTTQLKNDPNTRGNEMLHPQVARLQIVIEADQMWVKQSLTGERREVALADWDKLAVALGELSPDSKVSVEVAANSTNAHPIGYQTLIAAMDTAVKAGFTNVGVIDAFQIEP